MSDRLHFMKYSALQSIPAGTCVQNNAITESTISASTTVYQASKLKNAHVSGIEIRHLYSSKTHFDSGSVRTGDLYLSLGNGET